MRPTTMDVQRLIRESERKIHELREINADLLTACEMVLQRWTFDNHQQHTHSWHDMQDCAEVIRAALEKAKGKQ